MCRGGISQGHRLLRRARELFLLDPASERMRGPLCVYGVPSLKCERAPGAQRVLTASRTVGSMAGIDRVVST
jgi:hypothetical protein